MAPPAKRQKRNVVASSESEDEEEEDESRARRSKIRLTSPVSSPRPSMLFSTAALAPDGDGEPSPRTPRRSRAKTANHPHNAAPIYLPQHNRGRTSSKSASNSPEKARHTAKAVEKAKSGNIVTFFTKQVQRQQAKAIGMNMTKPATRMAAAKPNKGTDLEMISDDDLEESNAQAMSLVGLADQRRTKGDNHLNTSAPETNGSTQKFARKPKASQVGKDENDMRPWADRFGPSRLDELAVHKRKVGDVRAWLEGVTSGRMRQRLLLLKGAAGTGKSTTVRLLAKDMDFDVLEWRNPVSSVAGADGFQSMAAQFEDFMVRGRTFGQLALLSTDEKHSPDAETRPLDRRKQIILVEDFPNTFTRSSTTLQSFRSSIIGYLASNTPPSNMFDGSRALQEPVTPMIMIISETLLSTTSAAADSFTAHRLLGAEILQHPGIGIIEFNAMAPTLLAKALELVVQKESRKSGRKSTPGPLVLKRLGAIGDVRSAIGTLEFLCVRGDMDGNWGSKVSFGKTKKSKDTVPLTAMEELSLELATQREASLGIFHAVGRVLYNKRDEIARAKMPQQDTERLPAFLSQHARPKPSQVAVDELIDEIGTDTNTFIAALHENYILSCTAPSTSIEYTSLHYVNGCLDALSESDTLSPSWERSFSTGSGLQSTTGDVLRQDEVTFHVAVRGLLFSLPHPVKRMIPPGSANKTGRGGDPYKMFYPTSLKLWRAKEEIENTIDLWVTRLLMRGDQIDNSITAGASAFVRPKAGSIESWKTAGAPRASASFKAAKPSGAQAARPLLSIGMSARGEMLLERLPYMTVMARSGLDLGPSFSARELERLTSFHGIDGPSEEMSDDGQEAAMVGTEDWATDRSMEIGARTTTRLVVRQKQNAGSLPTSQPEQKLVLSDDDIED